jgi:molecular chaperone HscB
VDFSSNYFEVFGLPVSYQVDSELLEDRYHRMQREFHPDRYAGKPSQEQRLAVQYASVINQAFTTLKSPLLRAQYLLTLQNIDSTGDAQITTDPEFLMRQIELREKLAEVSAAANAFESLESVAGAAEAEYRELQSVFEGQYARAAFQDALETVAKMQFFKKLLVEVEQLEHELDD